MEDLTKSSMTLLFKKASYIVSPVFYSFLLYSLCKRAVEIS